MAEDKDTPRTLLMGVLQTRSISKSVAKPVPSHGRSRIHSEESVPRKSKRDTGLDAKPEKKRRSTLSTVTPRTLVQGYIDEGKVEETLKPQKKRSPLRRSTRLSSPKPHESAKLNTSSGHRTGGADSLRKMATMRNLRNTSEDPTPRTMINNLLSEGFEETPVARSQSASLGSSFVELSIPRTGTHYISSNLEDTYLADQMDIKKLRPSPKRKLVRGRKRIALSPIKSSPRKLRKDQQDTPITMSQPAGIGSSMSEFNITRSTRRYSLSGLEDTYLAGHVDVHNLRPSPKRQYQRGRKKPSGMFNVLTDDEAGSNEITEEEEDQNQENRSNRQPLVTESPSQQSRSLRQSSRLSQLSRSHRQSDQENDELITESLTQQSRSHRESSRLSRQSRSHIQSDVDDDEPTVIPDSYPMQKVPSSNPASEAESDDDDVGEAQDSMEYRDYQKLQALSPDNLAHLYSPRHATRMSMTGSHRQSAGDTEKVDIRIHHGTPDTKTAESQEHDSGESQDEEELQEGEGSQEEEESQEEGEESQEEREESQEDEEESQEEKESTEPPVGDSRMQTDLEAAGAFVAESQEQGAAGSDDDESEEVTIPDSYEAQVKQERRKSRQAELIEDRDGYGEALGGQPSAYYDQREEGHQDEVSDLNEEGEEDQEEEISDQNEEPEQDMDNIMADNEEEEEEEEREEEVEENEMDEKYPPDIDTEPNMTEGRTTIRTPSSTIHVLEGYSPIRTPVMPPITPTPAAVVGRRLQLGTTPTGPTSSQAAVGKRPAPGKPSRQSKKKKSTKPRLATSLTRGIFTHFCGLKVKKEVIETVEEVADEFWKNLSSDLMVYAKHAHRITIDESDVELLMKRQGFITEKQSLYTLIEKHLPLEYRQQLIPIARSGNRLEPNWKKKATL